MLKFLMGECVHSRDSNQISKTFGTIYIFVQLKPNFTCVLLEGAQAQLKNFHLVILKPRFRGCFLYFETFDKVYINNN